jgi:hypothetical protein
VRRVKGFVSGGSVVRDTWFCHVVLGRWGEEKRLF